MQIVNIHKECDLIKLIEMFYDLQVQRIAPMAMIIKVKGSFIAVLKKLRKEKKLRASICNETALRTYVFCTSKN